MRNTSSRADPIVTSLRLDRETHARLVDYAQSQHRTLSQQLRKIIDELLAAADRDVEREAA
jgi:predicted DNA-binding protein